MPQISSRPLKPEVKERLDTVLLAAISSVSSQADAQDLIQDLLTPTEQEMIKKRIGIAVLLEKGYDYRTIAEILKVSTTTVSKISLWLHFRGGGYRKITKRLIREERGLKVFRFIDNAAYDLMITPYHNRGGKKARKAIARRTPL